MYGVEEKSVLDGLYIEMINETQGNGKTNKMIKNFYRENLKVKITYEKYINKNTTKR